MTHSVESIYQKVAVLHNKALELHRERYKTQGSYDKLACQVLFDEMKQLAQELQHGGVDFDIDFGKTE
jgi:hypothetical protein